MGSLTVDGVLVGFDDRLLTHLQIVIVNRLSSGRPVLLSWLDAISTGDGRSSIWLSTAAVVHFKFAGSRAPTIDRDWIRLLNERADSGPGLVVCDETGALQRATDHRRVSVRG